jgi:hypothetical protein
VVGTVEVPQGKEGENGINRQENQENHRDYVVIMMCTGLRNAIRPQKKKKRDAWSRRGIISTTVFI